MQNTQASMNITEILWRKNVGNGVTERLFIRRHSTSLVESLVCLAITLNGIVLSSDGRLKNATQQKILGKNTTGNGGDIGK